MMNGSMNSVILQIQKALSEAKNEQFLLQSKATLRSLNEQPPQRGWILPD